jgi:mono/diheme cytochrome c family protein
MVALACLARGANGAERSQSTSPHLDEYTGQIRPLLQQYCYTCHNAEKHKGSLNLERFESLSLVRKELKPWVSVIEMLEAGEMPPEGKRQPTAEERKRITAWLHNFLNAEAIARAGDPGAVPLRRLSNAEYNYTIRDLIGIDLQPAREFPADGAAGEGFTNAAEALAEMSPTLLNKYLNAAKEIADHAVLLPDGIRFSTGKTRRDWTNECMASIREFYAPFAPEDGRLPLQPYLAATIRYRETLASGLITPQAVADKEKLNAKYLGTLWQTLAGQEPSYPLDRIRAHWRRASEKDAAAIAAEISAWQAALWKVVKVGSYRENSASRQAASDPVSGPTQTLKLSVKPTPGQTEVVVYLATREAFGSSDGRHVVWHHPRFEGAGKPPLLLRDYAQFGPAYEVDYAGFFADCPKYLAAAIEAAADRKVSPDEIAKRDGLNSELTRRWIHLLALQPVDSELEGSEHPGRAVPLLPLKLLSEKTPKNPKHTAINGWRQAGIDLPVVLANSSDTIEHIPGTSAPHKIVVHPTPQQYVASAWTSPMQGRVRVTARVAHVHAGCGNGVGWWIEHRHGDKAEVIAEGLLHVFGKAEVPPRMVKVEKGDMLILAVDANGDHNCDLTQIDLTIAESAGGSPARLAGPTWDLAADVADNVQDANPHADRLGNAGVWSFVEGATRPIGNLQYSDTAIPDGSVLARWKVAARNPARQAEAGKLAGEVRDLLAGPAPDKKRAADFALYANLVQADSPLFNGLDLTQFARPRASKTTYGLPPVAFGGNRFGPGVDDASVASAADSVIEVRLSAKLFKDHEFVVDMMLDAADKERVILPQVTTTKPAPDAGWDGATGVVAADEAAGRRLHDGFAAFRGVFPMFICYPHIIPVDEVVCLKQFHRDDEPLLRLFLDEPQKARLDRLWEEHRFISQWPISENKYLPLFIGFVTQDNPKAMVTYFEGMREPFRIRAEKFQEEIDAAIPSQLEKLLAFAERAYRRPLTASEKSDLLALYQAIRKKGAGHEEAFRGVLTRVLVSSSFLFRIEQAPAGKQAGPVSDWELATRLSYFLWSTAPDDELRTLAAAGRLHEPAVLAHQAQRMLADDRTRALAIEFGTQWIHVHDFDEFKEKNEKLFPMFDEKLRSTIYEESILFFQDLFQKNEPITDLLDANYTYANETLAKYYGIPGITGPQWRKVSDVRKHGRGGILGLASVQSKTSGASRTSPVLRGNWVVETLLGEKLPRPPADVPRLPEQEGGEAGLTTRQMVEKHTRVASCAVCHTRIDPFGFAFERYDPIGRFRDKETTGLPIETHAKLKDGTEFDGIDGLRTYLLTKKKEVIVRLFCRRLLGYALGRAVTLSDQTTIDEMMSELKKNDGHLSAAVLTIVRSQQFRSIRGSAYSDDE